jgi:hypothetical protein
VAEQPQCPCEACLKLLPPDAYPVPHHRRIMVLCPTCGNKRCPHAADHRYECSGSNEPNQVPKLIGETPVAEPSNRFIETDWLIIEQDEPDGPLSDWAGLQHLTRCDMCMEDAAADFMVDSKSDPRKFYRDTKENIIVCANCMGDYLKEEVGNE